MVESTALQICPESPISVHLYWDLVTVRSHGSNHFLTHQTSQWALVPCGWGTFSSWRRPLPSGKTICIHSKTDSLMFKGLFFPLICHLHGCPYVVCVSSSAAGRLSFKDSVIQVKKEMYFFLALVTKTWSKRSTTRVTGRYWKSVDTVCVCRWIQYRL